MVRDIWDAIQPVKVRISQRVHKIEEDTLKNVYKNMGNGVYFALGKRCRFRSSANLKVLWVWSKTFMENQVIGNIRVPKGACFVPLFFPHGVDEKFLCWGAAVILPPFVSWKLHHFPINTVIQNHAELLLFCPCYAQIHAKEEEYF